MTNYKIHGLSSQLTLIIIATALRTPFLISQHENIARFSLTLILKGIPVKCICMLPRTTERQQAGSKNGRQRKFCDENELYSGEGDSSLQVPMAVHREQNM